MLSIFNIVFKSRLLNKKNTYSNLFLKCVSVCIDSDFLLPNQEQYGYITIDTYIISRA